MPWTSRRSVRRPRGMHSPRCSWPSSHRRFVEFGARGMAAFADEWQDADALAGRAVRVAAWRAAAGRPCARRGSRWGAAAGDGGRPAADRLGRSERQAHSVIESAHASRFRPAAVRKHRLVRWTHWVASPDEPVATAAHRRGQGPRARARGSRPRRRRRASPRAASNNCLQPGSLHRPDRRCARLDAPARKQAGAAPACG